VNGILGKLLSGNDIIEYEVRVNDTLNKYDDAVCCTYDVTRFSASVIMDALRVHPAVIIGGILQGNPFYVPPDEFLRELRERAREKSGGVPEKVASDAATPRR
jgi:hypothetical protein